MNLNDMKISTRLSLGFGLLLVLMLVVALSDYRSLSTLDEAMTRVADDRVPKVITAGEWEVSVLQSARHMRNVLILDGQEAVNKELASLGEQKKKRKDYMEDLVKTVHTDAGKAALKLVIDARADYVVPEDEFMKLAAAGDLAAAKKVLLERARPTQLKYIDAIDKFADSQKALIKQANVESVATFASARNLAITLVLLALGIGVAVAFWLTRSLIKQLGGEPGAAADLARSVAQGDLAVRIDLKPGDNSSLMAQLQAMQTSLAQVVTNVRQGSEGVATASAEIAQGNQDLSARTEQQASALEETAASMEELSATVKQNADTAKQANQLAQNASTVAVKGGDVVGQVVETMKGINDASKRISDIISVIDGIAFQTNILALNAAVEAARAGEQGRGFAVVASEVRSLAGRSADAAKEIKTLINTSVERVEQGTTLVDQAGVTMSEVVTAIKHVTDLMGEISAASNEQSAGVAQVGEAVTQMDQVTQQNAALVEEMAAAATSLKSQAQQLVGTVAVFKLSNSQATTISNKAYTSPAPVAAAKRPSTPVPFKAKTHSAAKPAAPSAPKPAKVVAAKSAAAEEWESF